jgi:hypothetical protein
VTIGTGATYARGVFHLYADEVPVKDTVFSVDATQSSPSVMLVNGVAYKDFIARGSSLTAVDACELGYVEKAG